MIESLKKLDEQVSLWPGISRRPYHSSGRQFRLGSAEIGRISDDGAVEISFTRPFRDAILAEGRVQTSSAPDSTRVVFCVRSVEDIEPALWLLRLSYLRYALKAVPDPSKRLEEECARLGLSSRLKCALQRFVPHRKKETELVA
jgi:hypothetical protein